MASNVALSLNAGGWNSSMNISIKARSWLSPKYFHFVFETFYQPKYSLRLTLQLASSVQCNTGNAYFEAGCETGQWRPDYRRNYFMKPAADYGVTFILILTLDAGQWPIPGCESQPFSSGQWPAGSADLRRLVTAEASAMATAGWLKCQWLVTWPATKKLAILWLVCDTVFWLNDVTHSVTHCVSLMTLLIFSNILLAVFSVFGIKWGCAVIQ